MVKSPPDAAQALFALQHRGGLDSGKRLVQKD